MRRAHRKSWIGKKADVTQSELRSTITQNLTLASIALESEKCLSKEWDRKKDSTFEGERYQLMWMMQPIMKVLCTMKIEVISGCRACSSSSSDFFTYFLSFFAQRPWLDFGRNHALREVKAGRLDDWRVRSIIIIDQQNPLMRKLDLIIVILYTCLLSKGQKWQVVCFHF